MTCDVAHVPTTVRSTRAPLRACEENNGALDTNLNDSAT
jgi:hypothetical protein